MSASAQTATNSDQPCSEMDNEMNSLRSITTDLQNIVDSIQLKLAPVSRTQAPTGVTSGAKLPEITLVPLASEIRTERCRIDVVVNILRGLNSANAL